VDVIAGLGVDFATGLGLDVMTGLGVDFATGLGLDVTTGLGVAFTWGLDVTTGLAGTDADVVAPVTVTSAVDDGASGKTVGGVYAVGIVDVGTVEVTAGTGAWAKPAGLVAGSGALILPTTSAPRASAATRAPNPRLFTRAQLTRPRTMAVPATARPPRPSMTSRPLHPVLTTPRSAASASRPQPTAAVGRLPEPVAALWTVAGRRSASSRP
jgi:hypothetical protein